MDQTDKKKQIHIENIFVQHKKKQKKINKNKQNVSKSFIIQKI